MSCCSTIRSIGSGIVSMFSPTPCHTCVPVTDDTIPPDPIPGVGYNGFLLMTESGHILRTESGNMLSIG